MQIFSIGTNVILLEKSDWLDEFKQKHNEIVYDYHVTLVQPRNIIKEGIKEVKEKLNKFFKDSSRKSVSVTFNSLVCDDSEVEENNGCIMVMTKNEEIVELQKDILDLLKGYHDYVIPKTEEYEKNFRPHITIADNLNREKFELAKADLRHDCSVRGLITKVVLSVVCDVDSKNDLKSEKEEVEFELNG